jgi:lipoprotein-anchoring transpeptidase ErfK/SrfK
MRCHHIKSMPPVGAAAAALLFLHQSPSAYANVEATAPAATTQEGSVAQPNTAPPPTDKTAATPQATSAPVEQTKPKPLPPTLVARINLTTQTMTVQAGNKTLHTWKVSSGAPGYATPPGTFKPGWMARMWHSRQYDDAPMPHSVFFNGGIAVHATTSIGNLGRAASHGCVRLAPGNAEKFYNLVTRHGMARTRIVVHGAQPFSVAADRIGKINREINEKRRAGRMARPRLAQARGVNDWVIVTPARQASAHRGGWGERTSSGFRPSAASTRTASRRAPGRAATVYRVRY